jgi:hypothetical protein
LGIYRRFCPCFSKPLRIESSEAVYGFIYEQKLKNQSREDILESYNEDPKLFMESNVLDIAKSTFSNKNWVDNKVHMTRRIELTILSVLNSEEMFRNCTQPMPPKKMNWEFRCTKRNPVKQWRRSVEFARHLSILKSVRTGKRLDSVEAKHPGKTLYAESTKGNFHFIKFL